MRRILTIAALPVWAITACTEAPRADPSNALQVTSGQAIYAANCASCHGANLEGQPEWKSRRANGRMPAPPHDDTGHTWHHPDDILFGITKVGVASPYAPPGYQSDMPAFGGKLTDQQIWDVLAYITSRWSPRARAAQAQIQKQRAAAPGTD
ncbi:MAG: cytochrome c [Burkholderiaceae bacterium]